MLARAADRMFLPTHARAWWMAVSGMKAKTLYLGASGMGALKKNQISTPGRIALLNAFSSKTRAFAFPLGDRRIETDFRLAREVLKHAEVGNR